MLLLAEIVYLNQDQDLNRYLVVWKQIEGSINDGRQLRIYIRRFKSFHMLVSYSP